MTESETYEQELDVIARADDSANDDEYAIAQDQGAGREVDQQAVDLVASLAKITGEVVAARRGDHWKVADKEAMAWAEAAVPVLEKYAPGFEASPELALVLVSGMIVLPRIQADKAAVKAKLAEMRAEKGAGDAGSSRHEPSELP